jgi:hypothetical protein
MVVLNKWRIGLEILLIQRLLELVDLEKRLAGRALGQKGQETIIHLNGMD